MPEQLRSQGGGRIHANNRQQPKPDIHEFVTLQDPKELEELLKFVPIYLVVVLIWLHSHLHFCLLLFMLMHCILVMELYISFRNGEESAISEMKQFIQQYQLRQTTVGSMTNIRYENNC